MQDGSQEPQKIRQDDRDDTIAGELHVNGNSNNAQQLQDNTTSQDDINTSASLINSTGPPPSETTPRGKKRKLAEIAALKRSRALSPPWKKFEAEGPTTFTDDGKRRSGRTNALPLDLEPQQAKRKTRAEHQKTNVEKIKTPATKSVNASKAGKGVSQDRATTNGAGRNKSKHAQEAPASVRQSRKQTLPAASSPTVKQEAVDVKQDRRTKAQRQLPAATPVSGRSRRLRGEAASAQDADVKQIAEHELSAKDEKTVPAFRPIKSLRINFRPPPLPLRNPSNILPARKYPSLRDFLLQDDPLEGEEELAYNEKTARQEADTIRTLELATRPGQYLHGEAWLDATTEEQEDPDPQYTHPDYLLKHIVDFQPRLERERAIHIATARRVAHAAVVAWRRRQPKTDEELWQEQQAVFMATYKRTLKELDNKWGDVIVYVKRRKLQEYEEEQQKLGKKALDQMLDYSSQLLVERRRSRPQGNGLGDNEEEDEDGSAADDDEVEGSGEDDDGDDDDDDDDDSDTSSESDVNDDQDATMTNDDALTAEELKRKYSSISEVALENKDDDRSESGSPDHNLESQPASLNAGEKMELVDDNEDVPAEASAADPSTLLDANTVHDVPDLMQIDPSKVEMDEVDDILLDDEDESGTEDSDDSDDDEDSDEDEDGDSEEVDSEEEEAQPAGGLLGFFTKKQVKAITVEPEALSPMDTGSSSALLATQDTTTNALMVEDTPTKLLPDEDLMTDVDQATPATVSTSDPSRQMTPSAASTAKPSVTDSTSSIEADVLSATTDGNKPVPGRIDVPSLLTATLREYQHNGLDWLAGMHRNQTNGILADEMGLGKTIQTISLLAHLAESRQIWGPHLVIVPTSVMLNWEMEFKKFCPGFKILTYYGNQDERRAKRRGWTASDMFNVCITSYQLALADAAALKRRDWHFMVLDEAHNIKNFRSKRWQTLLTFKAEARLLLTGTPLQNNLSELWSLLFFLRPGETEQGGVKFADLATFNKVFHRPVDQIMEGGRETLDDEAKESVAKLHRVLRPHLLRRLKADVEKQMPKKYEHIVKCRLSKRQRQLYDGYMGLADTRQSFQSGNYMSIINCLMQLRKVCNHPDLFETRQIVTSYAMPKSAVADYEIKELLVRKRWVEDEDPIESKLTLLNLWRQNVPSSTARRVEALAALQPLALQAQKQRARLSSTSHAGGSAIGAALSTLDYTERHNRFYQINDQYLRTATRAYRKPAYPESLLQKLQLELKPLSSGKGMITDVTGMQLGTTSYVSDTLREMVVTLPERCQAMKSSIEKFGCITPAVIAPKLAQLALTREGMKTVVEVQDTLTGDGFHEARTRLSIAFPDKNLIQYDCGKLQALAQLLRDLQSRGSRALIFTQMTKVLDILEQFLNLHGHRYLRLDGSTRIEQRQVLTERFNTDPKILAFILSSRSGGIGINLTGADTVIFYDLDWNPAMDKQCQDRCHRIGQTRDVHIYRFISEGTIEANILRKSNQKRMLDDVVIQEGDFTTEYFNRIDPATFVDADDEVDAAVNKVFGSNEMQADKVLEQAEDKEDRDAAENAQKEYVHMDEEDFEDDKPSATNADTPKSDGPPTPGAQAASPAPATTEQDADMQEVSQAEEVEEEEPGSYEEYMLRLVEWELKDVVVKPPSDRSRRRAKKGKDYIPRIRR